MTQTQRIRGMGTINFFADDHEAAKQWYTEILGLEPYFNRPGYAEFRLGDYQQELGLVDRKYVPHLQTTTPAGVYVYWHVDDIDEALEFLVSKGATPLDAIQKRGDSGFVTASVIDPFGNILGIMYNPHYVEMLKELKKA